MCLLHEVLERDDEYIRCRAVNHRDYEHPMREDTGLAAISGIEYAAQAMAIHGAICSGSVFTSGVLAAVRNVTLHVERLDNLDDDLIVTARKLLDLSGRLMYEFELHAGTRELLRGRATVVLGRNIE